MKAKQKAKGENKGKFTRILSIDGGGIRGVIPARILVEVERLLREKSGNPDASIADHFDLIAGTSTGGILACLYLCPDRNKPGRQLFDAQQALDMYLENGDDIFSIPLWHRARTFNGVLDEKYPADGLEELLEEHFGDTTLNELPEHSSCLVTSYDIKRRRAHFFSKHAGRSNEPGRNFLLREVARATAAAPTYFEVARVSSMSGVRYPLIDGGVFANNPALCAYAEARKLKSKPIAKDMVVLSLGTGKQDRAYYYGQAKDWGLVEWIRPVLDIMMAGVADTVDFQLAQIFDASGVSPQYLRIQPDLEPQNADMDNVELENLRSLSEKGTEAAQRSAAELESLVDLLL